jgi:putative membrane protein
MRLGMMRQWKVLGLLAAIGAAPLALAGDQGSKQMGKQVPEQVGSVGQLLTKLHYLNQAERQFGILARDSGHAEQVRQYGEMLIRDHENADRQVVALAEEQKLTLDTVPLANKPENKKPIDELNRLREEKDQDFDRAFLITMVKEHDKAIALVNDSLKQFQGTPVAELLQQLLPSLKHHRQRASDLLDQLRPAAARRGPPLER